MPFLAFVALLLPLCLDRTEPGSAGIAIEFLVVAALDLDVTAKTIIFARFTNHSSSSSSLHCWSPEDLWQSHHYFLTPRRLDGGGVLGRELRPAQLLHRERWFAPLMEGAASRASSFHAGELSTHHMLPSLLPPGQEGASSDARSSFLVGGSMTLDGMRPIQLSLAHRREPQVIFLVEADFRANRPECAPATGLVPA
jgi:hypothetical protein